MPTIFGLLTTKFIESYALVTCSDNIESYRRSDYIIGVNVHYQSSTVQAMMRCLHSLFYSYWIICCNVANKDLLRQARLRENFCLGSLYPLVNITLSLVILLEKYQIQGRIFCT